MAEKAVQTANRIVMKATASGRDPYVEIYSTFDTDLVTSDPREPRGYSNVLRREARETEVEEKQEKQKTFYDRTRAGISVGDQILMRKNSHVKHNCR